MQICSKRVSFGPTVLHLWSVIFRMVFCILQTPSFFSQSNSGWYFADTQLLSFSESTAEWYFADHNAHVLWAVFCKKFSHIRDSSHLASVLLDIILQPPPAPLLSFSQSGGLGWPRPGSCRRPGQRGNTLWPLYAYRGNRMTDLRTYVQETPK